MKLKLLFVVASYLIGMQCMAQLPSYVPASGLVAWYPFNGNANDESGNSNNGVANNVTLELDRNGNANNALGFWNSNSSVIIQSITQPGIIEYSVTGWFKKSGASINQEGGVFCGSNPCNGPGGLRFHIGSTNQAAFGAEYQNCSSIWAYSQNQNYADDTWHSFAVIFNSEPGQIIYNQFVIYIDGIQIQSVPYYQGNTSNVISPINNNGIPTILGNAFGGGDHFKGILDDIGIWNRALSSIEISRLFNQQAPCNPISYSLNATITEGETYSFNGQNLTTAGTYTATLQNAAGCDSLITLALTVNPVQQNCEVTVSDSEICSGETVNISIGGFTPSTGTCSSENMPANLQQGLVAWYPFCGNAEDESPNNYNGTVRNAVPTADRFGNENQAYSFTTGQDIIVNGTQGLNLYPMSISLWYNVDTIASIYDEANIFSKYSPAAWNGYAIITSNMAPEENNVYYPTVKPWYTRSINSRIIGRYGSAPFEHENIDLDAWHHMVFTVAPDGGKCYVNGELIATDTWDGIAGPSSSSFIWKIGGLYDYWYNGKIDDIAVYNRVLSAEEAVQLYQYQAQSEATAILWSTGETTPFISVSPTATTTYSVTVTQGTQTCTSEVTIVVDQPSASTLDATITEGESYSFGGQNLTSAGTYTATLQNAAGCDSVVTLNLTVEPAVEPLNCEISARELNTCLGESINLSVDGLTIGSGGCSSENMPENLQNGLVAWYPFCGNADDESSNNYNGVVLGSQLTFDRNNQFESAYHFDGIDDKIVISHNSALNAFPFSVSLWFKAEGSPNDGSGLITKYFNASWNGWGLNISPSNIDQQRIQPYYLRNLSNNVISGYGNPDFDVIDNLYDDEWHHIVFTVNQDSAKIYFDGQLNSSQSWKGISGPITTNMPINIGWYPNSGVTQFTSGGYFKGIIDDIAIFNKALSSVESSQLYSYTPSNTAPSSILWSTGETAPSISVAPNETTTYNVTVSQGNQTCTSEVTIVVNQPSASTLEATITEGESYSFNGQNLTTAGTYNATFSNAAGCDSVVTLNLSVNPAPSGCFAATFSNFVQGTTANGLNVAAIRSNPEQALNQPETVVDGVVNFVSLGFGGSITLAFETPVANGAADDIRIDEATWGNNPCNRYPERADVFASQDGSNFVYLGQVCQDATLDLGVLSWAQFIRIVDASDLLSFNADADGFDVNGIECLNGPATVTGDDGLVGCSLQDIVSYTPGTRKNGTPVPANRSDASKALGTPQNNNTINFVSLGFGGTLVAKFDYVVFNQAGNDLRVTETSFGNPSCANYPEKARISVSLDNVNWVELGELCQDGEIDLGTLPYAQYIKIMDASPLSSSRFNGAADGYDVDAVVVLNNGCGATARFAEETAVEETMDFNVYPNPIEDYAIILLSELDRETEFELVLIDAAGRIVMQKQVLIGNEGYTLFVSDLARGIYSLTLSNAEQHFVKRLVK